MRKVRFLAVAALAFASYALFIGSAAAVTFVPASPSDTDSAYLIDNYSVLINQAQVNTNFNFNTGTFSGFNALLGTQVISELGVDPGAIKPSDGSAFFAFANTGPLAAPSGGPGNPFVHQNIMQPFSVSTPVDSAVVSLDLIVLTNQEPPTTSDPDWFHYLIWKKSSPTGPFAGTPYNLWYEQIGGPAFGPASGTPLFSFHPADPSTGFRYQTDLIHLQVTITNFINDSFNSGFRDFEVHAVIAEALHAPEPGTLALLGLGLAGLAATRRRRQ